MKYFAILCAALIAGCGMASAQYVNLEPGTVLTYTETAKVEKDTYTSDFTSTVADVTTGEDGVVSVTLNEVHKVPGNDLAEVKATDFYTYNPADGLTTHYVLRGEDYKNQIIDFMIQAANSQGQYPTDSQIDELRKEFKVKGDLVLPLPANVTDDAKIANSSVKINAGTTSMSMNLWEGKYLGKESVEVPAGNFDDCEKVSFVLKTTSPQGNERKTITTWYAKGVGVVKQVSTDKKGTELESTLLKSIKK